MDRTTFEYYKSKEIYLISFIGLVESKDIKTVIEKAKSEISTKEPGSLLVLTDITNISNHNKNYELLREFAFNNSPYVKASAVAGVTGVKQKIFEKLVDSVGREIKPFPTLVDAKEWLVKQ